MIRGLYHIYFNIQKQISDHMVEQLLDAFYDKATIPTIVQQEK
jgi:hypothetical protein